MAAVVGALRVVLGADSAALDKGLKDAQSSLKSFADGAASIAAGIGLEKILENLAFAFTNGVKHAITLGDELGKLSQKVGVPVEELSKLKYAAELSDVSMSALGQGLIKLSKSMTESLKNPTSEAAKAFEQLGVKVTDSDGKLKSSATALKDIAEKYAGLNDTVTKTTNASTLFGKAAGPNLIPLLNTGKTGIAAMGSELEKFGGVISGDTAKASESFNDNLKRLSTAIDSIWRTLAANLLPYLEKWSEALVGTAKEGNFAAKAAEAIGSSFDFLIEKIQILSLRWSRLGEEWKAWRDLMETDVTSGKVTENFLKFTATLTETETQVKALKESFKEIPFGDWADGAGEIVIATDNANKKLKDLGNITKESKNALESFISSQNKSIAAHEAEAAAVGQTTGTKEKLKAVMQAEEIVLDKHIQKTPQVTAAIAALGDRAEQSALQLAAMKLEQEFLSPYDRYIQQMTDLDTIMQRTSLSAATFQQAAFKIKFPSLSQGIKDSTDLAKSLDTLTNSAISSLSSSLANIVTGAQSASDAFKAFGKAVLTQLIELIVKALVFKAIQIAIGFTGGGGVADNWASVEDLPTSLSNFAGGGAVGPGLGGFVSGPGSGTSDSILARLSDGEFVVNAASAKMFLPLLQAINSKRLTGMASGGMIGSGLSTSEMLSSFEDRSARGVVNVTLNGDNYSRDGVRSFLNTVKELVADGYELKLA